MNNIKSFKNNRLRDTDISAKALKLIRTINEYKEKQDIYNQQPLKVLSALEEEAITNSTRSSNAIEGIRIPEDRLMEILKNGDTDIKDSIEGQIIGYKNVLKIIHSSFEYIPVDSNHILQFHGDLYRFHPAEGGRWKSSDNAISETLPDGTELVRFKPVSAFETPQMMQMLCEQMSEYTRDQEVESLILVAVFILDFLCIHPFSDGNGRMSRLLTLLLLYKFGYEIGRFVSLEKIIQETGDMYYQALQESSQGWHEAEHDVSAWLEYFLEVVLTAYKEFEERIGVVEC